VKWHISKKQLRAAEWSLADQSICLENRQQDGRLNDDPGIKFKETKQRSGEVICETSFRILEPREAGIGGIS